MLSRPGPSKKTTFGPPSAGGSKNRFTVRFPLTRLSAAQRFIPLVLILFYSSGQPYGSKCKDCKQTTTQNGAKYCHSTSPPPHPNPEPQVAARLEAHARVFFLKVAHTRKDCAPSAGNRFWIRLVTRCPASDLSLLHFRSERACGTGACIR